MAQIKNVSGVDREVSVSGGMSRLVLAGQVIEVPDEDTYAYTCQEPNWAPADKKTTTLHDKAHAADNPPDADPTPELDSDKTPTEG